MPNIAVVLKEEISRLAKKEVKANTSSTKGAVAQFRRDIAKLKRLVQGQQKEIAFLKTQERSALASHKPRTAKRNWKVRGSRHVRCGHSASG